MKFVFLAGGFAGFLAAGGSSFFAGHGADRIFFDAAMGCLLGALLFRWFWTVLVRGIRETIHLRNAAAVAATPAPAAAAANGAPRPAAPLTPPVRK